MSICAPGAARFGERRNPGLAAANRFAQGIGKNSSQQRIGVFLLAIEPDDAALAITLRLVVSKSVGRDLCKFNAKTRDWRLSSHPGCRRIARRTDFR